MPEFRKDDIERPGIREFCSNRLGIERGELLVPCTSAADLGGACRGTVAVSHCWPGLGERRPQNTEQRPALAQPPHLSTLGRCHPLQQISAILAQPQVGIDRIHDGICKRQQRCCDERDYDLQRHHSIVCGLGIVLVEEWR